MRNADRATLDIVVETHNRLKAEGRKVSNRIVAEEIHGLVGRTAVGEILKTHELTGSIETLDPSIKDIRCMNTEQQHFLKSVVLTDPTMDTTGFQKEILRHFGILVHVSTFKRIIGKWRLPSSNATRANATFELDSTQIEKYPANACYLGRKLTFKGKARVVQKANLSVLKSAKLGHAKHSKSRFSYEKRIERERCHGHEDMKMIREEAKRSLDPNAWTSNKLERWECHVGDCQIRGQFQIWKLTTACNALCKF